MTPPACQTGTAESEDHAVPEGRIMRDGIVAVCDARRLLNILMPDHHPYAVKDFGLRGPIDKVSAADGKSAKNGFVFKAKLRPVSRIVKTKS